MPFRRSTRRKTLNSRRSIRPRRAASPSRPRSQRIAEQYAWAATAPSTNSRTSAPQKEEQRYSRPRSRSVEKAARRERLPECDGPNRRDTSLNSIILPTKYLLPDWLKMCQRWHTNYVTARLQSQIKIQQIRWTQMISNLRLKLRSNTDEQAHTRRLKTEAPAPEAKKCGSELSRNTKENDCKPAIKIKVVSSQVKQILKDSSNDAKYFGEMALKRTENCKKYAKKQSSLSNHAKFRTEANQQDRFSFEKSKIITKIFKEENCKKNEPRQAEGKELVGEERYLFENKVGSGTFGIVHKARDRETLEIVAIKKVFQDKKYKNRQLQILKMLKHPNLVQIKDSFFTYDAQKEYLNVVMDYYPFNLSEFVAKAHSNNDVTDTHIKVLAFQLFKGLLYLEGLGIAHRDMKPQNVLVNDKTCQLIVCDLGSAKKLQLEQTNLAYICSRSYRAPQLIFGCTKYNCLVDIWSAGCILVEMVTHQTLFRAGNNIDQLVEIIKVLGTPSAEEIKEMNPDCDLEKYKFPKIGGVSWEKIFCKCKISPQYLSLVKGVLRYSPKKRLSAFQVLKHPFFNELRQKQTYKKLRSKYKFSDLFDFSSHSPSSRYNTSELVPSWWCS